MKSLLTILQGRVSLGDIYKSTYATYIVMKITKETQWRTDIELKETQSGATVAWFIDNDNKHCLTRRNHINPL